MKKIKKQYTKQCLYCSKEFITTIAYKQYCDLECNYNVQQKRIKLRKKMQKLK